MTSDQPRVAGPGSGASGHVDWGVGRYELTASDLLPAAHRLVEHADVRSGERVLDVGCGTRSVARGYSASIRRTGCCRSLATTRPTPG